MLLSHGALGIHSPEGNTSNLGVTLGLVPAREEKACMLGLGKVPSFHLLFISFLLLTFMLM